jgi:L-alanine-DL-glutamate epimerase-like enolase superfamily enzyme
VTEVVKARLRAPFVSAQGSVRSVDLVLESMTDGSGVVGHGEGLDREAALDLARWDLAGRQAGQPVWRLLGATEAPAVEVNATIASRKTSRPPSGFRCVKVKVGIGDDLERVAALREAIGADVAIRLDANGAWSPAEAVSALCELEQFGIELCEQPSSDAEACAEVAAASAVPIALDESAPDVLDHRVCEALCLKISRFGGITGVVEAARRARVAGYRLYLASALDGPLGIAAALHAAAVIRPDYACGLATLGLFDGRTDPMPPSDGRIAVPDGPGLGDGLLGWYGAPA